MKGRTYRYFKGDPLYPFGYGLSYTKFNYSGLKLSSSTLEAGKPLDAEVTITNTGSLAGDEVAQLYLVPPQQEGYPIHNLAGFQRVHLAPKASTVVHFKLDPRDLSEVDTAGKREVRAGSYQIYVGGGQPGAKESTGMSQDLTITGSAPLPE